MDIQLKAMYFSRSSIPHIRSASREDWLKHASFFKHLGIYAYRSDILSTITSLPETEIENQEKLEQLKQQRKKN